MLPYRGPSVWCPSVTFVHPAKTVRRNEMPFGRDIHVVSSNIILDMGPGHPGEGEIWGSELPVRIDAAYHQTTLAVFIIQNVWKETDKNGVKSLRFCVEKPPAAF